MKMLLISKQAGSGSFSGIPEGLVRGTRVATGKEKTVNEEIRAGPAVTTTEALVAIRESVGTGPKILTHQEAMMKTIIPIVGQATRVVINQTTGSRYPGAQVELYVSVGLASMVYP